MAGPRYLTKSRFKLGCECETKLYYTGKPEYADQSVDDPFLLELAKGGYQVGELAKYYLSENAAEITVEQKAYEEALEETELRIKRGDTWIAEAAIRFENLFIRADILRIDTSKKLLSLYEVKSKSWSSADEFIKTAKKGENRGREVPEPAWKPYLMDIAFQKYVAVKAYPGYDVKAYLVLVNKESRASVDGLNQLFKVREEGNSYKVIAEPGLTRSKLGEKVLVEINVDKEVDLIWNGAIDSLLFGDYGFVKYITALSDAYSNDKKLNTPVSKACKTCQFYKKQDDRGNLKSGLKECWEGKLGISGRRFNQPRVTGLWGGKAGGISLVQKMIDNGIYFIEDIERDDINGAVTDNPEGELTAAQRRWEQVRRVRERDTGFYIDRPGLAEEMSKWKYPLHFIDFETSSPALPFTKGSRPFEGIAFQYSHHTVTPAGNNSYKIEHKNQFLKADPGVNPNLDFIRELKRDLSEDEGTIFRYHNHENAYLRMIYSKLLDMPGSMVPDRNDLLRFIDSVTQYRAGTEKREGSRNMVDMWDLVLRFYYSPHAGGSNSLKQILPAAINDSDFLKEKYSKPVCGKNMPVTSLNFDARVWIDEAFGNDPYKTLDPVFEGYENEQLDEAFSEFEELKDGGAAMMAYARLQFFNTNEAQREAIKQALFRYCELDTLAMVMLWEFWEAEVRKK